MKQMYFAVLDKKANLFTQLMHFVNEEVATRVMTDCVNTPNHNYNLNPDDYDLYLVGNYDDESAELENDKIFIVNLGELPKTGRGAMNVDVEKIERDYQLIQTRLKNIEKQNKQSLFNKLFGVKKNA